ncbi:flagellar assembly protein FliH [Rhodopseudomonas faecalis]|uniref:Flagellar assembly protein FliH n=1 Tax=Rhodopseudomonas faecalis TaxID=99655 RepID=A0A318TKN3_9BRAD|nr:FliH/SctL family protein [Rhodopseudomonas faecalis]PYF04387.1 flagellar assembly protein FliH [Rhodopseudomonas faecalis]TAH65885.1 MAG: flagellar assembly protein H [Rhodopseudomonas palustris]
MAAPAKFLFDLDFGAPEQGREKAPSADEIAAQVAAAEQRGYQLGFQAGQNEAKAESDRRVAMALEQIGGSIRTIATGFSSVEARMETEAVEVAVAVARKLCTELMASQPLVEINALVSDCFRQLVATPHIVIRINDGMYERAHESIERLARQNGYEGRLVIMAEPDIAYGDCRIEWADGGVVLERAAIEEKISELVGRYVASRNEARGSTAMRT